MSFIECIYRIFVSPMVEHTFTTKQFLTVGKVNMDLIAVNLEDDNSIKEGDWVEFWGFEHDLTKFSKNFDTISYQLMTNLSGRVEKNYLK